MTLPTATDTAHAHRDFRLAVIGAGPAGLMAADVLAGHGHTVHVFDGMASVGRKFLLAGRGGLNLTHAEPMPGFLARYGASAGALAPALSAFDNEAVRRWAQGLGQPTFVGTSNRVFPVGMKASPLLRAWLTRLQQTPGRSPVQFHLRHRWLGWEGQGWVFDTPEGRKTQEFDAVVLALGGGSWARLGSDGAWVPRLQNRGVEVEPLQPSNCGFALEQPWSAHFQCRFAGQPLKSVVLTVLDGATDIAPPVLFSRKGEFVVTDVGVEGSLIYAASAALRKTIAQQGRARVLLDLLPDHSAERVWDEVSKPRGSRSLSTHLKSRLGIDGIKMGLLHEVLDTAALKDARTVASTIKALPLNLGKPSPMDEAISTAGGVAWGSMDDRGMLNALPGVFCAGEMLDWDAPTGGYLLTACLAGGRWVGEGVNQYLQSMSGQ